jgi:hypothetical protein
MFYIKFIEKKPICYLVTCIENIHRKNQQRYK